MVLDLCEQNMLQAKVCPAYHFRAPNRRLQGVIVAIGEEGIRIAFEHRFQEMQCAKYPIVQKDPTSLVETGCASDASKFRRARYDG